MGLDHGLLRGDQCGTTWGEIFDSELTVVEWRKANAIHRWFVENVQDGRDDYRRYPVTAERLRELLSRLDAVLAVGSIDRAGLEALEDAEAVETAKRLLPTVEGFYGETYVRQLRHTRDTLEPVLHPTPDDQVFTYWSSW